MFCRNCGKSIPDNSKFCPYCGSSCELDQAQTTTVSDVQSDSNSKKPIVVKIGGNFKNPGIAPTPSIKNTLDKLGPEKTKKFLTFSTIFKISSILCYVGIPLYFAGSPILSVIDYQSSKGAITFQKIYICLLIIYSLVLIATTILDIVLLVRYKKDFQIQNAKVPIITKSVCMGIIIGLIVALILRLIAGETKINSGIQIASMILCGLCFVTSAMNGWMCQPFAVLTKKKLRQIYPDKKF